MRMGGRAGTWSGPKWGKRCDGAQRANGSAGGPGAARTCSVTVCDSTTIVLTYTTTLCHILCDVHVHLSRLVMENPTYVYYMEGLNGYAVASS